MARSVRISGVEERQKLTSEFTSLVLARAFTWWKIQDDYFCFTWKGISGRGARVASESTAVITIRIIQLSFASLSPCGGRHLVLPTGLHMKNLGAYRWYSCRILSRATISYIILLGEDNISRVRQNNYPIHLVINVHVRWRISNVKRRRTFWTRNN